MKFITLIFLIFSNTAYAMDDLLEDYDPYAVEIAPAERLIDVSKWSPTALIIRESMILALYDRTWTVTEQTDNSISAEYESNMIRIELQKGNIKLQAVKYPGFFDKGWFDNLERDFIRRLQLLLALENAERFH